jgi:hypothetical protein
MVMLNENGGGVIALSTGKKVYVHALDGMLSLLAWARGPDEQPLTVMEYAEVAKTLFPVKKELDV